MRRITNITEEAKQRHTILFQESEIVLRLQFNPTVQIWSFDAEYKNFRVFGLKLSCGVLHMRSKNQPFDFVIRDASGTGLDPFRSKDFSEGRCELYLVEPDELREIRGVAVPI